MTYEYAHCISEESDQKGRYDSKAALVTHANARPYTLQPTNTVSVSGSCPATAQHRSVRYPLAPRERRAQTRTRKHRCRKARDKPHPNFRQRLSVTHVLYRPKRLRALFAHQLAGPQRPSVSSNALGEGEAPCWRCEKPKLFPWVNSFSRRGVESLDGTAVLYRVVVQAGTDFDGLGIFSFLFSFLCTPGWRVISAGHLARVGFPGGKNFPESVVVSLPSPSASRTHGTNNRMIAAS